jgi:hypothetical protein
MERLPSTKQFGVVHEKERTEEFNCKAHFRGGEESVALTGLP